MGLPAINTGINTEIVQIGAQPTLALAYDSSTAPKVEQSNNSVLVLALLLSLLQVLDGMLTATGILSFGTGAEGNAALRYLMELIGVTEALFLVKAIAIGVIFGLYTVANKIKWIPVALKSMIVIYTFAAVVPWSAILLAQ